MKVEEKIYLIDSFSIPGIFSSYLLDFEKKVIIEPCTANGAKIILNFLSKLGLKNIDYVAVTHVHIDHGGGAAIIAKNTNAKILVHPKGAKHLVNPEKLWQASKAVLGDLAEIYGKPESIDEDKIIQVEDLQSFDLGDDELISIHAPGHASHMVAYYLKKRKILFPSDAVGMLVK
ncbi:MAG: MBL fold metallo-hydrolase [Archaeoglobaceae archaeon]